MSRIVYYTLVYPSIPVGSSWTIKKTLPEGTIIKGIFLETTHRYQAEVQDVRNQQGLGTLASKVNLINGYRFSNKLGTDIDVLVTNLDTISINPLVIIETEVM